MDQIPQYSEEVMDYIKAIQKQKLAALHGPTFEDHLDKIFPSKQHFLDYIEQSLEKEFGDNFDERYELEALLKNNAIQVVPNLTKYEFLQHKMIVNSTEMIYRNIVPEKLKKTIPYNTTLYSIQLDAEIKPFDALDKPIICFHGELFSANLMFCKLIIKMISTPLSIGTPESYAAFSIKKDQDTLRIVMKDAISFYQYYFSPETTETLDYDLTTTQENTILAIFLDAIQLFIYSHECGHQNLGHFAESDGKTDSDFQKEEFQADAFAMAIMGEYQRKMKLEILSLIAPVIFFRFRVLYEKYVPMVGDQNTHPPTIHRLENYKAYLKAVIHPIDHGSLNIFLAFEEELSNYVTDLFDRIHVLSVKS